MSVNGEFKIKGWCSVRIHLHGLIEGDESVCHEVILSVKRDGKLTKTDE